MTAINDLVEAAGALAPLQALDDMARALQEILALEVFRVEFRMPAEPVDVMEEPEPASVSQIDPYAFAREMEVVLRGLVVPGPSPATLPVLNIHSVTRELRERLERLEKETVSLPAVCSLYTGALPAMAVGRPLAGGQSFIAGHASPQPPVTHEAPSYVEGRIVETQAEGELLEKSVERSSSVVRELEDVCERLASSAINLDKEIKKFAIDGPDNARALASPPEKGTAPAEAVPPVAHGRNVEVPAFKLKLSVPPPSEQAADNVRQLSDAIARSSAPGIEPNSARAPEERPAMPEIQAPAQAKTPVISTRVIPSSPVAAAPPALAAVHNSLSIVSGYLASAAVMAGAMDRMMAGGIITRDTPELSARAPAELPSPGDTQAPIRAETQSSQPARVAVAPPALAAAYRSFNTINGYLASAAWMAGVTGRIPGSGISAPSGPGQLAQLVLDNAAPASSPVNALMRAGESIIVPVPQPILIEGGRSSPAMLSLARDTGPGYLPSGREAINVSLPGTVQHVTDNNTTNKISSFHNTFNITVTVKGGGDGEGDLRDLGKKIGRILSEEIKRYGGI